FDVGDALDRALGVAEAATAPLQVGSGAGSFFLELPQVPLLGADPVVSLVYGELVGAAKPAASAEVFEVRFGFREAAAGSHDGVGEPDDLLFVHRNDAAHGRKAS